MSSLKPLPLEGNPQILVLARSMLWGVLVEYTGPSVAALLEAKCISPMMADQLKVNSTGRSRKDEHGDKFSRKKRALQDSPERLEISRYIKSSDARELPGVAAWLDAEQEDQEEQEEEKRIYGLPGGRFDVRSAYAQGLTGARDMVTRNRAIGRYQRRVQWNVFDQLIVVDWTGLLRERMVASR